MPLYVDIMNQLASEINVGKYRPGSSLPSERELCLRFNASQKSIRSALSHLQTRGYIDKKRGSGSYVRQDTKRTGIINLGVVINSRPDRQETEILDNPFFVRLLDGASQAAAMHDANVSMFIYNEFEKIDENTFIGYRHDGLLNFYFVVSEALAAYLAEHKMKVVSTVNSFQLAKYDKTYSYPCVVSDYLSGIEQAVQYYRKIDLRNFGYFANALHGLDNYELYKQVLARNDARFDTKHVVIYPESRNTNFFIRERAEYFASVLFKDEIPDVVFSDGDFIVLEIIAVLTETKRGRDILSKTRFCAIGLPELESTTKYGKHIDFVIPQNEKVGKEATQKLIEYIKDGGLPTDRYFIPAKFFPASENRHSAPKGDVNDVY